MRLLLNHILRQPKKRRHRVPPSSPCHIPPSTPYSTVLAFLRPITPTDQHPLMPSDPSAAVPACMRGHFICRPSISPPQSAVDIRPLPTPYFFCHFLTSCSARMIVHELAEMRLDQDELARTGGLSSLQGHLT